MAQVLNVAALSENRDASFVWVKPAVPGGAWTPPEAFLVILMLAATCDHGMGRLESELLQHLTHRWCSIGVIDEKDLEALNYACVARLGKGAAVLGEACAALPERARRSAFAQALDIMMCDRSLREDEAAFAQNLAANLNLSGADIDRIAAVIAIKHAY